MKGRMTHLHIIVIFSLQEEMGGGHAIVELVVPEQ